MNDLFSATEIEMIDRIIEEGQNLADSRVSNLGRLIIAMGTAAMLRSYREKVMRVLDMDELAASHYLFNRMYVPQQ